ncbi:hypothetical protein C8R46DRAFT_1007344 [Mycena filopes]|nr:hypothetical protein C8R46DRAFT_1007344 [Mycena filopes]
MDDRGQDWRLLNLDKREGESAWPRLADHIFDGAGYLGRRLEAANCERPAWNEMILPFNPGERHTIFGSVFSGETRTFILPKTAPPNLQTAPLVNLPVETIDEIFSCIPLLGDILCLSATCQVLWAVGRRNIYPRIAVVHSWAGDRIMCVGDHLKMDEIPDSILSAGEKQELSEYIRTRKIKDGSLDTANTAWASSFALIDARRQDLAVRHFWWLNDNLARIRPVGVSQLDAILLAELCRVEDSELWRGRSLPPSAAKKVLRNLSRRQYVRESVLVALKEKYAGQGIMDNLGFGTVVMSRICLSLTDSESVAYDGDIHQGVWAGDRFDVVSENEFLEGDAAWCDASDEVSEEVEAIYMAHTWL